MIPLRDTKTSGRFPWITILLIAINVWVFYLEITSPSLELFLGRYGLVPAAITLTNPSSWLAFITSMFLHGGLIHLVSNMWFLWIFGDNVENEMGFVFPLFYLLGGIIGSLTQYLISPHLTLPIVGASGAVAAVLGAYLILFPGHRVKTIVPILFFLTILDLPAFVMLGYWFLTQLFNGYAAIGAATAASGGVAYFAHIGGFAYGWIIGLLIKRG